MKKKNRKPAFQLPALADRRRKPRPAQESARERARAAAKRRKSVRA